ncbi:MAG: hypothetical protein HOO88_05725 [Kiritimatiellaceae bacterium]|nr:hypothetical protein [Kiritimatiellaceae bacterium]
MLLAIKNLSASRAKQCFPWETTTIAPSKPDWNNSDTDHCYFSGFEGVLQSLRIDSKNNPAVLLHWFVADYDGQVDQHMRDTVLSRCGDFRPQYLSRTFSGGARLLWKLETPFPLHRNDLTAKLMRHVKKKLKLAKILVGLDEEALVDPCKYYESGTDWVHLSDDVIPSAFIMQWAIESSHNYAWNKLGDPIPIDRVAAEVEKQYPGRWQGEFAVGVRGVRFWDSSADNQTAAVIRESGMQCFTGGQAFVPWSAILGRQFVNQFEADRVGGAVTEVYFDGREYWTQLSNGQWQATNKSDMANDLQAERGLSSTVPRGSAASEVVLALNRIRKQQYIACAAPLIHRPKGIVIVNGQRVLNTSTVEMFQPSEDSQVDPSRDFPWLSSYFQTLFDPVEQLDYFYAWLRRWYASALDGCMLPGQASFFAGAPNTGKTLLSTAILSRIFGGHIDASNFLSGEDNFNSHLFNSAVWAVDDVVPLTDTKTHLRFSALIKKMAANRTFSVREKYRVDKLIEWNGRVVVTCNTDPESIRILPDVDLSNRDKINLFRVADRDSFTFPRNVAEIIQAELPFFLRWLLNWTPPDKVLGDSRYGVQTYCEASLFEAARHSSSAYSFLEVLLKFFEGQVSDVWTGSATELLSAMLNDDDGLAGIAAKYTPDKVGRELSKLASQNYSLSQTRTGARRIWSIDVQELTKGTGDGTTPF